MEYQGRSGVVQAIKWTGVEYDITRNNFINKNLISYSNDGMLYIKTTHGKNAVEIGDWIVKDKKTNAIFPCVDDLFKRLYTVIS